MQLIEDEETSFDEDEVDEGTSSGTSTAGVAEADVAMSSKRQLLFMQMWGERRQSMSAQYKPQRPLEGSKQPPPTSSKTFVPSSAWRGLPEREAEAPANSSSQQKPSQSGRVKVDNVNYYDEDEDDEEDNKEENDKDEDDASIARSDQLISDESAVSVQSLCDAAAAAASSGGPDDAATSTDRKATSPTALREPSEIANLLHNIQLGRRHLYVEDSYAVKLERDLRVELRTELDKQQRFDARLESLSLCDEEEVVPPPAVTKANINKQQSCNSVAGQSEQKQQQGRDNFINSVGVASSLASRIKRRIGAVGARDSGEPAPAPQKNAHLDYVARKTLSGAATIAAGHKTKRVATATFSRRRRRDKSSSSSNSTSDSSGSSDSDPQINNRCRWRKSRVSSSNASNSNCSNADKLDNSSQPDVEQAAESNSSLPIKRPVFRAQGKGSTAKRADSHGVRTAKLNASEFEADPNQSVHLDRVYQSVEQLEPSGAVRILDPRQMIADLDGGWPTDQLKSAPLKAEISSDSVAFKPKASCTIVTPKTIEIVNETAPSQVSQPQVGPISHHSHSRSSQRHQNQEQSQQSEELAKPTHNLGNSDSPNYDVNHRNRKDERGRMKSQLFQPVQSGVPSRSGLISEETEEQNLFANQEVSVDEAAKQIVMQRRSQSGQSESNQSKPEDNVQGQYEDIDLDAHQKRFTSGHHGRVSVTAIKGFNSLTSLSPSTVATAGLSTARQTPAQALPHLQPEGQDGSDSLKQRQQHPVHGRHNRNSSNRVGRLKHRNRLRDTELMLAMHSTEPHFTSEGREQGVSQATPVGRRCRQVVMVQPQPVHRDLQLRQVVINPRALRHRQGQQKVSAGQKQSGDDSSDCSDDRRWTKLASRFHTGVAPLDGCASILQQQQNNQRRRQQDLQDSPITIAHWIRLSTLPQEQKPVVARVRRVLNDGGVGRCSCCSHQKSDIALRRRTPRIVRSDRLNWNVSHCTETVDNPSLIAVSDSEQQPSQCHPPSLASTWAVDDITASTFMANSISTSSVSNGCLSTFDAATVGSQSAVDIKVQPKWSLHVSPVLPLMRSPLQEADNLSTPMYLYCTSAPVENNANNSHLTLAKRTRQPKIGSSHIVYYLPSITVLRRNVPGLQQRSSLRCDSTVSRVGDSVTVLIACELIVLT